MLTTTYSKFSATLLGLSLLSSFCSAATVEVQVQEGDRLLVKGLTAQVQLVAQNTPGILRISGVDVGAKPGQYSVVKKDHSIEIKLEEFADRQEWKTALTKSHQAVRKIEIAGFALPTQVHLRDGSVLAQKWGQDLAVELTNGKVQSLSGSGQLKIHLQKGDVNVAEHNGKIYADIYTGNAQFKNTTGDMDVQQFAGNLTVDQVHGYLSIVTPQVQSKVSQVTGNMLFENGKGALNVQNFAGHMDGQTGEGLVQVSFLPDSELNIKSKSGRVTVLSPTNSGASLNLTTVEGEITVPKEVKVNRLSTEKNVRGRLRGELQKGSVIVHAQDASIVVK